VPDIMRPGFPIVAEEIRNFALQSAESARNTSGLSPLTSKLDLLR
jgi:hypothetical protein